MTAPADVIARALERLNGEPASNVSLVILRRDGDDDCIINLPLAALIRAAEAMEVVTAEDVELERALLALCAAIVGET